MLSLVSSGLPFEDVARRDYNRKVQACKDYMAVLEGQEKRAMLMEDPLEQKNYPNIVALERRLRREKSSLDTSSLGKRKAN